MLPIRPSGRIRQQLINARKTGNLDVLLEYLQENLKELRGLAENENDPDTITRYQGAGRTLSALISELDTGLLT
jgi:hypothetical protein